MDYWYVHKINAKVGTQKTDPKRPNEWVGNTYMHRKKLRNCCVWGTRAQSTAAQQFTYVLIDFVTISWDLGLASVYFYWWSHRPQSRVEVSVSSVSVSRWYRGVVSNVSVSSRSRLLTSRLLRTSEFKLRTITIKFPILYRDTWAA